MKPGGLVVDNHPDTPRKLQELARHEMITRLYMDILADMAVCDIEGWDRMEYIRQLQECLNRFTSEKGR
ncbi:MAG: hypothetical protein IJ216_06330 [Acidaminococcaceae bacterium]|nr:hypothetical protein [Acidaminococcaceae bacterium]MBQ9284650.1 hypothetical protein [Acidaminococcaceae bacterium]